MAIASVARSLPPLAVVVLVLTGASAGRSAESPDANAPFVVILQPDTQHLTENPDGTQLEAWLDGVRWVCDQREALRIRGFLTLGDLVQHGSDETEWRNWRNGISVIQECGIPILATIGNHDFPCNPEGRDRCGDVDVGEGDFNYVGAAPDFAANTKEVMEAPDPPWWEGRGPPLTEPACTETPDRSRAAWVRLAPGWGALALPWNDGDADGLSAATSCESMWAWSRGILQANPDVNFFVIGHRIVDPTGLLTSRVRDVRPLVEEHPNAVAVAGGHWLARRRFASLPQSVGGRRRAVLFANFQNAKVAKPYFGGLVIARVDPGAGTICYRSYSPYKDAWDLQGHGEVCHDVDLAGPGPVDRGPP